MPQRRAVIAGAGVGGLTAALCLVQHGWNVIVLEQAETLTEIGAGLQLSPNAMTVFRALGLDQSLIQKGVLPEAIELRMGETGEQLLHARLGPSTVRRWGAPYLHIHRADLIDVLSKGLNLRSPDSLCLGKAVESYETMQNGTEVRLLTGERIHCDLLIGADGIHSKVHRHMLGTQNPDFTGNVAWRLTVPTECLGKNAPTSTACAWMGKGKHAVTYRLRNGTLSNLVAVIERNDWQNENWYEIGCKQEALDDFKDWHPTIKTMISKADIHYKWAMFDRKPLSRWTDGNVCLLGDAAHPMLPFIAQGAAMAIEDSWALARLLDSTSSISSALQAYQQIRIPRTSMVQKEARDNAKLFHKRTRAGQLLSYGPMWMAGRIAPELAFLKQDKFYKYDIVEEMNSKTQ